MGAEIEMKLKRVIIELELRLRLHYTYTSRGLIVKLIEVLFVAFGNGRVKNHGLLIELARGQPSK